MGLVYILQYICLTSYSFYLIHILASIFYILIFIIIYLILRISNTNLKHYLTSQYSLTERYQILKFLHISFMKTTSSIILKSTYFKYN